MVSLCVEGTVHPVGIFSDHDDAALAYDMEALRAYGKDAPLLNFTYEVLEENYPANGNRMSLVDSRGLRLSVDVSKDLSSYSPIEVTPTVVHKSFLSQDGSAVPSQGAPTLPDSTRSWHDRNSTLYTPSTSFAYEITFPHTKSLGLNLKPHSVFYSPESDQFMGTLVVVEAMTLLSSLVYPGKSRTAPVLLLNSFTSVFLQVI